MTSYLRKQGKSSCPNRTEELKKKGKGNKPNADGEEYLEFNERQTKTRTGSDCRDAHPKRCHDGRD